MKQIIKVHLEHRVNLNFMPTLRVVFFPHTNNSKPGGYLLIEHHIKLVSDNGFLDKDCFVDWRIENLYKKKIKNKTKHSHTLRTFNTLKKALPIGLGSLASGSKKRSSTMTWLGFTALEFCSGIWIIIKKRFKNRHKAGWKYISTSHKHNFWELKNGWI